MDLAFRQPERINKLVLVDTMGFSRTAPWARLLGAATWVTRNVLRRQQPFPRLLLKKGEDYDWMCLKQLPRLRVPTLIVWKRHDPYFSVRGAVKASYLIPDVRLEIMPGFGHSPHVGDLAKFNELLSAFLQQSSDGKS